MKQKLNAKDFILIGVLTALMWIICMITSGLDYDSMVRVSNLIEQLSNSGVIVFVVSHDFEFIVRTCTEVVQLDDHGAIQNHRLSPEILKTLSEKYFN